MEHKFKHSQFLDSGVVVAAGFHCENCKATILYWCKTDGPDRRYVRELIKDFLKKMDGEMPYKLAVLWQFVTHRPCFNNEKDKFIFLEGGKL